MTAEPSPARLFTITTHARRFELLARRPEFRSPDRLARIDYALSPDAVEPLHLLDVALVVGASDVDRMCGYAVAQMRTRRVAGDVLDVLGMLDADRIVGMYYALPDDKRAAVRRSDGVWSHHVSAVERYMPDAIASVHALVNGTEPMSDLTRIFAAVDLELAVA